jgi:hypothetical protein
MPLSDGLECYYRLGHTEQNKQEKKEKLKYGSTVYFD